MNHAFPAETAPRDNLLGVCAAIAEVTGVPALAVRLAFVAALFVSVQLVLLTYVVAAAAIFVAERPMPTLRLARRRG